MRCATFVLVFLGCALLFGCGCALAPPHHGSGIPSPFFDDADTRATGIAEGFTYVPIEPDEQGRRSLVVSGFPLDPLVYVEAPATAVTLGAGIQAVSDQRGFYTFPAVRPGAYTLTAHDVTGAFVEFSDQMEVKPGAITTGVEFPTDPPEAPAEGYLPVGRDDFVRLRSVQGARDWRRAEDVRAADGRGVFRMSLTGSGGVTEDDYMDLAVTVDGVLWYGTELGEFQPPVQILAHTLRFGDRFDQSTTIVPRTTGGGATIPPGTDLSLSVSSVLDTVDDIVAQAGRFDNCPRITITASGAALSLTRQFWLAWHVGPVKMISGGVDSLLESAVVGGRVYQ